MAEVAATFTANIAPFQAAMGKLTASVKAATDATQTTGQKVGSAMTGIGKASTVAGVAVGAMAVSAIKSYGSFQESINKAAVIAGSSNKSLKGDMKALETEALSLGKTLPISAKDAGNAMIEMARNGASIKDLKTEFPAIAKASAVAGADLAGTATTVQQAMNIWGGGAKNAAKDSAILALNANMSNAEVEDMGQAFANVGSTAATLGIGIKDTSTAIGLMSNAGLGAAQGSQDLAHALTLMARPSDVAAGEMEKLGITYTDAQGKFKPFPQILKEVAKATDGMSQSQKVAALTNLYGAAGAKAMLPLLIQTEKKTKSGKSGWDAYSDSLGKVSGSAKAANKYLSDNSSNMTKNVGQAIAQMEDAFDAVVKTSIGSIAPQIQSVANALGNFATWLNKSKSPMASFVKGLIAWSPVIAIVLVGGGLLMTMMGKLVTAISAPAKAIKAITKSTRELPKPMSASAGQIAAMGAKAAGAGLGVGLAAAGFAALAFGIAALAKTGTAGLVALAAMTGSIVILAATFAILKGPLTAAIPAMLSLSAVMLSAGASALMIGGAIALAGKGINLASQGVMILVQAFVLLSQNMTAIVPTMTAVGQGFAMMIVGFVTTLASHIPQVSLSMVTMMLGILNTINTYMPQLMQQGTLLIVNFLNGLAVGMPQIILAATNLIVNFLNALAIAIPRIAEAGVNLIVALAAAIGDNANRIVAAGIALIGQLAEAFVTGLPLLVQIMGATMAAIVAVIATYIGKFNQLGGVAIDALKAGITGKKYDAVGAATDVIKSAGTAASKNGQAAFKAAGGNAAIQSAKAIANTKGAHQSAGSSVGRSGASGIKSTSSYFTGAGSSAGSAAARGLGSQKGHANAVGRDLGSSSANSVKSGTSGVDLSSNGSSLMSGFLSGIRAGFGPVQHFVSGIAGWIKAHKGPISYDAKLLIPAGNAMMNGLNYGLMNSFSTVQHNVSGMADTLADSINSVAGDIKTGDLSMQAASYQGGSIDQNIDTNNWVKPTISVHNELVGDKIRTIVSQGEADDQVSSKFFMN